jgi:alpha-1,2-mannosyltransferase
MPTEIPRERLTERALIALSIACAFGIFAFAGTVGLVRSYVAAVIAALGVAAFVAWIFWRHPILPYEKEAVSRTLMVVTGVATIAALLQLARLCVFIVNPAAVGYAMGPLRGPGLTFTHSCVSAYFVAAQSVPTVPDVYAQELYSLPSERPDAIRTAKRIGSFNIDVYEYPLPFLLLPRALEILAPDFLHFRMLWFALNGAVVLAGLLAVVRVIGPVAGTRALLLSPLIFASDLMLSTLQIGNLQAMVIALAMLAMVFLARHRYLIGGALLAYAILSKLFPGVLLVYLLVRRQWRALGWTVGLCAGLVVASLLDTGSAPYHAFFSHVPRLLGGEAFPAFRNPVSIARNYSVPGMVFKLHLFGRPGTSFEAMRIVGWVYTLIALAATVILARQMRNRDEQPIVWLAILILGSLRSPFLPGYGVLAPLWLLILLAATAAPTAKRTLLAIGVGEHHAFLGEAIDVGCPVAHNTVTVTTKVVYTDVIAPDDQDVRLLLRLFHFFGHLIGTSFRGWNSIPKTGLSDACTMFRVRHPPIRSHRRAVSKLKLNPVLVTDTDHPIHSK